MCVCFGGSCETESRGVFTAGPARFPSLCGYKRPMKRICVYVFAWSQNSSMHVLPPESPMCFLMRVTFYCVCFCVYHARTNWRNTCPSACWGWGSGCRLVSTADNTSLCNSRMSSIFENRIYKQRGCCEWNRTERKEEIKRQGGRRTEKRARKWSTDGERKEMCEYILDLSNRSIKKKHFMKTYWYKSQSYLDMFGWETLLVICSLSDSVQKYLKRKHKQ